MGNLLASDVKLADQLKPVIGGYNKTAQTSLADALGRSTAQGKKSAVASGRSMGGYAGEAVGRASTKSSQGIENSLAGILGQTTLNDTIAQREHEKKMALAREIGDLMSPSAAEEVLGGLSQGVNLASQGTSLYQALGQGGGSGASPSYGSSLNLYDQTNPFQTNLSKIRGAEKPYDYSRYWS